MGGEHVLVYTTHSRIEFLWIDWKWMLGLCCTATLWLKVSSSEKFCGGKKILVWHSLKEWFAEWWDPPETIGWLNKCVDKGQMLRQTGYCKLPMTNQQVRSAGVEPRVAMVVARVPEWGLLKPSWGLSLPAATWHRVKAQGPIMQTWLRKPEQGRDSSNPQQASFSRQT